MRMSVLADEKKKSLRASKQESLLHRATEALAEPEETFEEQWHESHSGKRKSTMTAVTLRQGHNTAGGNYESKNEFEDGTENAEALLHSHQHARRSMRHSSAGRKDDLNQLRRESAGSVENNLGS